MKHCFVTKISSHSDKFLLTERHWFRTVMAPSHSISSTAIIFLGKFLEDLAHSWTHKMNKIKTISKAVFKLGSTKRYISTRKISSLGKRWGLSERAGQRKGVATDLSLDPSISFASELEFCPRQGTECQPDVDKSFGFPLKGGNG